MQYQPIQGLPTDDDVICGRGRGIWTNPGNLKFKRIIEENLHRYSSAISKKEKMTVIESVYELMIVNGSRFLKEEYGLYYEINKKDARQKTARAIRGFYKRWKNPTAAKNVERSDDGDTTSSTTTNNKVKIPDLQRSRSFSDQRYLEKMISGSSMSSSSYHRRSHSDPTPDIAALMMRESSSSSSSLAGSFDPLFDNSTFEDLLNWVEENDSEQEQKNEKQEHAIVKTVSADDDTTAAVQTMIPRILHLL